MCFLSKIFCRKKKDPPIPDLDREHFGVHLMPVCIARKPDGTEHGVFPTDEDYDRIAKIGRYVVSHFPGDWWQDSYLGPKMRDVITQCWTRGLRLIVRLEDPLVHNNVPGAHPATQEWFRDVWVPYVCDVAKAGKGYVWAYQVGNEVWEEKRFMLGATGEEITADEYALFFKETAGAIRKIDPMVSVLPAGITTITEPRFFNKAKRFIAAGGMADASMFNGHLYQEETSDTQGRRIAILGALTNKSPWIITEINHKDPEAPDEAKWNIIQGMWRMLCQKSGRVPKAILAFCWQTDDQTTGVWGIKDKMELLIPWRNAK